MKGMTCRAQGKEAVQAEKGRSREDKENREQRDESLAEERRRGIRESQAEEAEGTA